MADTEQSNDHRSEKSRTTNDRIRRCDGRSQDELNVTGGLVITCSFGDEDGLGGPDGPPLKVALSQAAVKLDDDAALWAAIRNRTDAIRGDRYEEFIRRFFATRKISGRSGLSSRSS